MAKGKKKGGGGKKGKKGKKGEPEMSFEEAILAYKIGIIEKKMEDFQFEQQQLTELNQRHHERNDRLSAEQKEYIKVLKKQAREFDKMMMGQPEIPKGQVLEAMNEKWQAGKAEDDKLEELKAQILEIERNIAATKDEILSWKRYGIEGKHVHEKQISLLEKELEDMHESESDMAANIGSTHRRAKVDLQDKTESTIYNRKVSASEKAMATLGKNDRQEVLDNEWMKKELHIHRKQVAELMVNVEHLEQDNLSLMGGLFDCKVEDLKISRAFFLTQFEDYEDLRNGGILAVDLADVSLLNGKQHEPSETRAPSQMHQYVMDKVRSVETRMREMEAAERGEGGGESDSEDEEDYGEEEDDEGEEEEEDLYDNYLPEDMDDTEAYLKLGPLELKMLSVAGEKMPIHTEDDADEEQGMLQKFNPPEWPVTGNMLKQAVTPRVQ